MRTCDGVFEGISGRDGAYSCERKLDEGGAEMLKVE